jgi:hypothetical protein
VAGWYNVSNNVPAPPFGLQTCFNSPLDTPTLTAVAGFGFGWARIDAQTCSQETLLAMRHDAVAVGQTPVTIVADLGRLEALPAGDWAEWGNEPDGDILPAFYRQGLDEACRVAEARGLRLMAPAISNLDRDSLRWLERVRSTGWPPGLTAISAHRYGDGTFDWAHDGFRDRSEEVEALQDLCDGLPYFITEFGYPTCQMSVRMRGNKHGGRRMTPPEGLTEAQQAANIAREWAFWREEACATPFLYQINDGPNADEGYGIRRWVEGALDGWKPSAYTVPQHGRSE